MEPSVDDCEQPLTGGNVGAVVRRGDQVLRSAGPWTATVQRLLTHCRKAGLRWSPQPLGIHPDGREIVDFIDGDVPTYPMPAWVWTVENLTRAGRYLRQLHDATTGYVDRSARWRQPVRHPAEVVCHNDFAPYNMVFRDGRLVGVIDFDMASPGPRIWDLAYLAYRIVPLTHPDNPDGIDNVADRTQRLDTLIDSYGHPFATAAVIATAVERLRHLAEFSDQLAVETGRPILQDHAALYRTDATYLRV